MKIKLVVTITLFTVLSCQKEEINFSDLDITNSSLDYEIAVSGFISNENSKCKITLSKPIAIDEEIKYQPINDAVISLKEGDNKTYLFKLDSLGVYISIGSIQGKSGIAYNLEISYNNMIYNAEEVMPEEPDKNFDIPFYRAPKYDDNGNILPPDNVFIEFSILKHNFGYETPNIWQWIEGSEDSIPGWDLYEFSSSFFKAYTHKGSLPQGIFPASFASSGPSGNLNDSLEIIKMEISKNYYEYLLSVFNETDWKQGIFSSISGNVKTNLSAGGIGYFYAINVKRKRSTYKEYLGMTK